MFLPLLWLAAVGRAKLVMQQSFDEPSWPLCQCCGGCAGDMTGRYANTTYVGLEQDPTNGNQYFRVNNNQRYTYSRTALNKVAWDNKSPNITITLWVKFTNENKLTGDPRLLSNLVKRACLRTHVLLCVAVTLTACHAPYS